VVFSVRRITRRKFKGAVNWSAKNATYVAFWNQRQPLRMYYLSGAMNRPGLYKEYFRWLHQHSRLFLESAYTEEHIAHLSDSDEENEIIDEYDTITRQGTQQPECRPFQNYVYFPLFPFSMFI
jgi:hypothetical protein